MSEQNVIVLKALHIAIRAILVLASAFWLLILMELLPPLMVTGLDGARGKLVHIWTMDRTSFFAPCENSLQILHEGYTDVIVFLLITWTAVEVNRILSRLIVANAEAKQSSQ